MQTLKFVHWKDGEDFLGYLQDYPDYWSQAESLGERKENLADLFRDINSAISLRTSTNRGVRLICCERHCARGGIVDRRV